MWNGEPVRQSTRGVDRCGLVRRPKPGLLICPWRCRRVDPWLAARAVTACLGTCVLPAPACGHPIRPVLNTTKESDMCASQRVSKPARRKEADWREPPRGDGAAASLSRATESRAPSGPFLPATLETTQSEAREVGKWIVTSGKGLALRAGHGGPSPEPVGCRRTARAASAARAGRRVPAGGRIGNGLFGGLPRASNSQLRTGTDKGNPTV
ncbi:hypothetical protein L6452_46306 [Arctium lappa]|nr:hypothetical protein L6452_46306 [Arctium lappa]